MSVFSPPVGKTGREGKTVQAFRVDLPLRGPSLRHGPPEPPQT